ncbi:MAG: dTMP kinase [Spirochaetota bacterium]
MKIKTPLFIVFEGIDGAGKSTQAKLLYSFCQDKASATLLQEPTDSQYGKTLRKMLKGQIAGTRKELLELFIQDREYDVNHNIMPLLNKGYVVIVDRYFYSTAAYQAGDGIKPSDIVRMNIEKGFPIPERVYFIDIDPAVALERIHKRSGENKEIFETLHILETIRKNYLSIVDSTFAIIQGNCTVENIFNEVWQDFKKHFAIG